MTAYASLRAFCRNYILEPDHRRDEILGRDKIVRRDDILCGPTAVASISLGLAVGTTGSPGSTAVASKSAVAPF